MPIPCTRNAATHAIKHCQTTNPTAHFPPSSLFTEAIAATHGVYNKLNTSKEAAARGDNAEAIPPPNKTYNVDTTLSFAIKPLIKEVQIRQSPNPNGWKTGTKNPDTAAKILFAESSTIFKCRSKLCKNHTTIVAIKMTENAF